MKKSQGSIECLRQRKSLRELRNEGLPLQEGRGEEAPDADQAPQGSREGEETRNEEKDLLQTLAAREGILLVGEEMKSLEERQEGDLQLLNEDERELLQRKTPRKIFERSSTCRRGEEARTNKVILKDQSLGSRPLLREG